MGFFIRRRPPTRRAALPPLAGLNEAGLPAGKSRWHHERPLVLHPGLGSFYFRRCAIVSATGFVLVAVGVAGCGVLCVAAVLVVWAITHDRQPPST